MSNIFNISSEQNDNKANIEEEKQQLKTAIMQELPKYVNNAVLFGMTDPHQIDAIKGHMRKIASLRANNLKNYEIEQLINILVLEITSLGKLTPLIDDDSISEIMINGPKDIWIERKGVIERSNITYDNDEELMQLGGRIARNVGRMLDVSHPTVDARLPDGSRVHIIIPPVARNGVTITIRKFFKEKLTIDDLIKKETLTPHMARFLKALVYSKANIIVSGGTGSGKTTTLNVLSNFIPNKERIITLEDSAELQLNNQHIVSLETKNANAEGKGQVTIEDLVVQSLRMRPDRIIVGEVRDQTAYDLLNAMNTGHEGSMSTVHSNDPEGCIVRLTNLISQKGLGYSGGTIKNLIGQAVDAIVQISRMRDGSRKITHISLIDVNEKEEIIIKDIYKYDITESNRGKFVNVDTNLTERVKEKLLYSNVNPEAILK